MLEYIKEYKRNKIDPTVFVITGGGFGVCDLLKTPGASAVVEEIFIPYSSEVTSYFIWKYSNKKWADKFKEKAVCQDSAAFLFYATRNYTNFASNIVVCSAALTTNRERKGKNHAYIAVSDDDCLPVMYYVDLNYTKTELCDYTFLQRRWIEDRLLTDVLLSLALEKGKAEKEFSFVTKLQEEDDV